MFAGGGCVEQTHEPQPSEADVQAARRQILTTVPKIRYTNQAVLKHSDGGELTYLGLDINDDMVVPGEPFMLVHYFRVEKPVPEGWRMFVHLDAPNKKAHLTADHVPMGGRYPVSLWQKGEIIRDVHKVQLPANWPADKVLVYVGIWKGPSRFTVEGGRQDGQNRLLAVELPVRKASSLVSKKMVVRKLPPGTTMTIDGVLGEPAWKEADATGPFVNTMDGTPAATRASARVLWDQNNLYVAFEFLDSDIYSAFDKHDDKLWTQDAAELFIDADGDRKTYVELQVSPRNMTFDSWLPNYRENDNAWDAPLTTAVKVYGTVNKSDDVDTGWTVEMQIPLSAAKGRLDNMGGVPPAVGTEWRANFFRMDHKTGQPQAASGWSPPLVGDFHALDKFGVLIFADEQGRTSTGPSASPTGAAVRSVETTSSGPLQSPPPAAQDASKSVSGKKPAAAAKSAVAAKPASKPSARPSNKKTSAPPATNTP